jgi:hypothetical protein
MAKGLLDTADKEKRNLTETEKDAFDVASYFMDDISHAFDKKQERNFAMNAVNSATGQITRSDTMETWEEANKGAHVFL